MMTVVKIAPLAEVKDHLSAYIDSSRGSPIVVTRNGKPVALLTPILEDEDLDRLLLAHDPKFLRFLDNARARVRAGHSMNSDEFWRTLRRRRRKKSTK
jgi:prevent-host-death family protein